MNALSILKKHPVAAPSPARQALADALAARNENGAAAQAIGAERVRIQQLIEAEAAAQGKLAAIEAAEHAEILTWVEAGQSGDEPEPHHAERKAAERALRIAQAQAVHARGQLTDIDARHLALIEKMRPLQAVVDYSRQAVLAEVAETMAAPFREASAGALRHLHTLLFLRAAIQGQQTQDPHTQGFLEPLNVILKSGADQGALWELSQILWGFPGITAARDEAGKRINEFWDALATNAEARLD